MAISKETQKRIKAAQLAGYSDAQIFAYYKNNPKTKNRIIAASKDYSEADIAKEMGLNITVTVKQPKQPEQPKYEKPLCTRQKISTNQFSWVWGLKN